MAMEHAERLRFAEAVLTGLGAPITASNVHAMLAWMAKENTAAGYNPLASTYGKSMGYEAFNDNDGNPVWVYPTFDEGVHNTVMTFLGHISGDRYDSARYENTVEAFRAGTSAEELLNNPDIVAELETWGSFAGDVSLGADTGWSVEQLEGMYSVGLEGMYSVGLEAFGGLFGTTPTAPSEPAAGGSGEHPGQPTATGAETVPEHPGQPTATGAETVPELTADEWARIEADLFDAGPDQAFPFGHGSNPYADAAGIPAGFEVYRTDNEAFVVYSVDGGMGASANVYFDTTDLSDTLPAGTAVNQHEWSRLKSGWINGGTSDVLQTEEDFVGRSWNEIVVWALDQLNILGTDLLAEPDIVAGVASLIANPDMTDEEIEALFVGTDYWHRQTIRALEWNDLPHAQQTQEKIEAALGLLSLAEVWVGVVEVDKDALLEGFDGSWEWLTNAAADWGPHLADLAVRAEEVASGQATQTVQVAEWLTPWAASVDDSPYNRRRTEDLRLRGERDAGISAMKGAITGLYERQGMPVTVGTVDGWAKKVYLNQMTIEEAEELIKDEAAAKWIHKPRDVDWATWAAPYRNMYSSELETSAPTYSDPTLSAYLSNPDGQPNLFEFKKMLRKDGRWEKTQKARDAYHSTFSEVGRLMGFS